MGDGTAASLKRQARRELLEFMANQDMQDICDFLETVDNFEQACKIEAIQEREAEMQRMGHVIFAAAIQRAKEYVEQVNGTTQSSSGNDNDEPGLDDTESARSSGEHQDEAQADPGGRLHYGQESRVS